MLSPLIVTTDHRMRNKWLKSNHLKVGDCDRIFCSHYKDLITMWKYRKIFHDIIIRKKITDYKMLAMYAIYENMNLCGQDES